MQPRNHYLCNCSARVAFEFMNWGLGLKLIVHVPTILFCRDFHGEASGTAQPCLLLLHTGSWVDFLPVDEMEKRQSSEQTDVSLNRLNLHLWTVNS